MRTLLPWLLPAVLAGSALWSLADAHYFLLRLASDASTANVLSRAGAVSLPPEDAPGLVDILIGAIERARTAEERNSLACAAERTIIGASQSRPASAPIALSMARLSQTGPDGCGEPPLPEYSALADFALRCDPVGSESLLAAGRLYERAGQHGTALSSFRRALELSAEPPAAWLDEMLSMVRGAEDLPVLIPPLLRSVNRWSTMIFERDPELHSEATSQLDSIRAEALAASLPSEEEPLDSLLRQSLETFAQLASGVARAEADARLAFASAGSPKGLFFASRRKLADLRVMPSTLARDGRPTRSSFVTWGGAEAVRLDSADASVGFYLAPNQTVRRIEVRGHPSDPMPSSDRLVVYASDDNLSWKELRDGLAVDVVRVDSRPVVVVKTVPRSFRYWKLHFPGSSEPKSFRNRSDGLLRVFGDAVL